MRARAAVEARSRSAARACASFVLAASFALAPACAASTARERVTGVDAGPIADLDAALAVGGLIAPERYTLLDPAADPLAAHREPGCALGEPRVEDGTLELETNDCVLFWVGVPLRAPVRAGEPLRLVRTHSALVARTPGDAHLRVDLDGDVLLDRAVPIPSPDAIDLDTVTPARDHAAGALLRVHLHNHGANNWRVVALER